MFKNTNKEKVYHMKNEKNVKLLKVVRLEQSDLSRCPSTSDYKKPPPLCHKPKTSSNVDTSSAPLQLLHRPLH